MNRINKVRVVVGGVVSGLIIFGILGFTHGRILHNDWMAWANTIGAAIHGLVPGPDPSTSMKLWLVESILAGTMGVLIYAGIRPRFGAGPATALKAGVILWLTCYLTAFFSGLAMGVEPHRIMHVGVIAEFVAALLGTFVGAAIYKE